MLQKDLLGQDMFLIGPPGHFRRTVCMKYLSVRNSEPICYLSNQHGRMVIVSIINGMRL